MTSYIILSSLCSFRRNRRCHLYARCCSAPAQYRTWWRWNQHPEYRKQLNTCNEKTSTSAWHKRPAVSFVSIRIPLDEPHALTRFWKAASNRPLGMRGLTQTMNTNLEPCSCWLNQYPVFEAALCCTHCFLVKMYNNLGHSLCSMMTPQYFETLKIIWDTKTHLYPIRYRFK